jgi:hypothetical protein
MNNLVGYSSDSDDSQSSSNKGNSNDKLNTSNTIIHSTDDSSPNKLDTIQFELTNLPKSLDMSLSQKISISTKNDKAVANIDNINKKNTTR